MDPELANLFFSNLSLGPPALLPEPKIPSTSLVDYWLRENDKNLMSLLYCHEVLVWDDMDTAGCNHTSDLK